MLFSCASVKPPQGGPEDNMSPKLESTFPTELTNLEKEQKITIFFNEFIKEESLKSSIEFFPRVDEKVKYLYGGKEVTITLPSKIENEKTYILSFNSNFSDENNVKLDKNIVIPLSLSDSIDDGKIFGKIFGNFKKPSVLLWKGKIDKSSLLQQKPDYILSASNDYNFDYLEHGVYTILAVDLYNKKISLDENKVSFFNKMFIDISNNNILPINFYFNASIESDSLEVKAISDSLNNGLDNQENISTLLGNIAGDFESNMIMNLKNEENNFHSELSIDGRFKIKNIKSGKYQLLSFVDINNNKMLDIGSFDSDDLSEIFFVYPDSLFLRSNWELEIENWNLNNEK